MLSTFWPSKRWYFSPAWRYLPTNSAPVHSIRLLLRMTVDATGQEKVALWEWRLDFFSGEIIWAFRYSLHRFYFQMFQFWKHKLASLTRCPGAGWKMDRWDARAAWWSQLRLWWEEWLASSAAGPKYTGRSLGSLGRSFKWKSAKYTLNDLNS